VETLIGKLSQPKHQKQLALQMAPDFLPYLLTTRDHRRQDFFHHHGRPATPTADQFPSPTVYPVAVLFSFVLVSQSLHGGENEFLQIVSPCFRHKHASPPTEIPSDEPHAMLCELVRKEPGALQIKKQFAEEAPSLHGGGQGFRNRVAPHSFRRSTDRGAGLLIGF
jgi:hypothetical protein